ncbi:hypothetical protein CPAR01_05511 [Colletotrichum paranaense]|uniref:Uncharacterized protein n=1 Tax=Colletotrichum paranaense TaxID=1914294 RepID=A0ABQ9SSC1_9PEZI|nr:uncharacterized protein CPAR01_05511 [Colletotrichum paranaense]KAK1542124.1 hypothetical protein CPAR01_05511 [Colletotrichum paranaense]
MSNSRIDGALVDPGLRHGKPLIPALLISKTTGVSLEPPAMVDAPRNAL